MKRILSTLVAVVAVCFCASAQQKGEQSLGLHLGYDTSVTGFKFPAFIGSPQKIITNNGHNLAAGIEYSYFVANNLRISASFAYGLQADTETTSYGHSITIAPALHIMCVWQMASIILLTSVLVLPAVLPTMVNLHPIPNP